MSGVFLEAVFTTTDSAVSCCSDAFAALSGKLTIDASSPVVEGRFHLSTDGWHMFVDRMLC